ncbi:MAG: DUF1501 domain-containing protein [Planctomycetaceae bacterium]|nr:MAG: DUF1501 domain-containing protein [Planctomycetaceae bacterium]
MVRRRVFMKSLVASSLLFPGIVSELLAEDARRDAAGDDPLAPRLPHAQTKAKNVIFLFMSGGVSHVDSFDNKPRLFADHGKEVVLDHPETRNRPGYEKLFLKRPQWTFAPHGQSGIEVSDLFPHMAGCVDDLTIIRSMHTAHSNHYNATLGMHTGSFTFARPSIGSWVSYGLGTENRNLPSFVVIAPQTPYAGTQVWDSDFLPPAHQGTRVIPGADPMPNLKPRISEQRQSTELAALARLNRRHQAERGADGALAARIRTFETAVGMQSEMPEVFDLSRETDATLGLYGLQRGQNSWFGWEFLVSLRLAERGVRFVELIDVGSSNNWDAHGDMLTHGPLAKNVDQPIAGLIRDLKQRGMFDETLVVWTTEFGRTPFNNVAEAKGREHHPWAFTSWLAGAGVRRGVVHGATDEYGIRAVEQPVDVNDFHATILHLMGLDHLRLTFRHSGRDFRLTDVAGNVVEEVLA